MAQPYRYVLKSAAMGALIMLAAGPVVGVCLFLYRGIATGNPSHFVAAILLAATASISGAAGGMGYAIVSKSRPKTGFWVYLTYLATMESYLVALSYIAVALAFVAPRFVQDLPATEVRFHLALHAYGICLVTAVSIFVFLAGKLAARK